MQCSVHGLVQILWLDARVLLVACDTVTARLLVESQQQMQQEQRPSLQGLPDGLFQGFGASRRKDPARPVQLHNTLRQLEAQVLKLLSLEDLLNVFWPTVVGRNEGHGDPHLPGPRNIEAIILGF